MTELIIELLGYVGMILVLLTLALARKHFFKSQIISSIGGAFLVFNAFMTKAYPFMILNFIWTLISIYNLCKDRRDKLARKT